MRTLGLGLVLLVTAPVATGCSMLMPVAGQNGGYVTPQGSKDRVVADEAKSDQMTDPVLDQELAKQEKEVAHALAMALGREGAAAGMPAGDSSSKSLAALRSAKFKLRIEPVTDASGASVAQDFVQLKDSFTERVQALQAKLVAGTASPAERAEVVKGARQVLVLNALRAQVSAVSRAALMTNNKVQTGGLTTMLQVAGMVSARKQMSMDWTDQDYARVKRLVSRQKRWEALAAATMGMLGAYEAVIGGNGDPKALDAIASSTLDAFPLDVQVSDQDARDYVSHLSEDAAKQKARYEGMMRAAYGDAVYEARYKAGIDAVFARAANASQTRSSAQLVADTQSKYDADLAKCARGEPVDPGSLVGPAKCQAARAGAAGGAGSAGGGASLLGSLGGLGGGLGGMVGGVGKGVASVQGGMGAAQKGLGLAQSVANGDAAGTLQGVADMFPGDGPIQSSLQGVAALAKGDYKGALKSAMGLASLVPGGGLIAKGLGAATKLLDLFG